MQPRTRYGGVAVLLSLWGLCVSSVQAEEGPEVVEALDPTLGELPESITLDGAGNLYLSMSNRVERRSPGGAREVFATLPLPDGALALGAKAGPDGYLYVASASFAAEPSAAFVFRIPLQGGVPEVFAALPAAGFPNDLAFGPEGMLYVTDPFLGAVYRITPAGEVELWLEDDVLLGNMVEPFLGGHEFGVDGIAFSRNGRYLYLNNLDYGRVLRVALCDEGQPGPLEVVIEDPLLQGVDGMAFDRAGKLFLAVNGQDRLVILHPNGSLHIVAEGEPLDAPSSLVFSQDPQDLHTLYISSFAINRALGNQPGMPRPALLMYRTATPGLPLN